MKRLVYVMMTCGLLIAMPFAMAQQSGRSRSATKTKKAGADGLVARMMQFDKNKDGELTKAEVTDARLKAKERRHLQRLQSLVGARNICALDASWYDEHGIDCRYLPNTWPDAFGDEWPSLRRGSRLTSSTSWATLCRPSPTTWAGSRSAAATSRPPMTRRR